MLILDPILVVFPAISDLIPVFFGNFRSYSSGFYGDFILFHWFFMVILDPILVVFSAISDLIPAFFFL